MFEYIAIREELYSGDIGKFTSFGIKVMLVINEQYEIGIASDISDDVSLVRKITNYCNKNQVNPIDLRDTVSLFI